MKTLEEKLYDAVGNNDIEEVKRLEVIIANKEKAKRCTEREFEKRNKRATTPSQLQHVEEQKDFILKYVEDNPEVDLDIDEREYSAQ